MLFSYDELVDKYDIKINGVIHVGGHLGEEISDYKKQTTNIHIFEPLEWCYDKIDSSVHKYNVALGSTEKTVEMYVANNNQSSSILAPKEHLNEHSWVHFTHKKMVEVKTLDSYNITSCNFLNIDVQGYELEVLKGSSKTLDGIDYILIEINEKELYENCPMVHDLDSFLTDFERVETYMTPHGWGDAFYVRKNNYGKQ